MTLFPFSDPFSLFLPAGVWILIVCIAFSAFVLRYTRFGRHVYAVGSNEETARLCGVPVGRTKLIVYALTGAFCGLAGLMQFSYIGGVGQPTTAVMYELFIIAAVIIGGASFSGGEGSVLGTIIGALIITMLYMGGQQMGWPKWVQEMVIGGIIILAVAVDRIRHRRFV
ncbi:MAG: ABC transporter permease [Opitutaceae bacterium]